MRSIALFLGAGFSVPWGLPVTKDLLPPVRDAWKEIIEGFPTRQRKLAERVREAWIEHHSHCSGSVDEFARMLQIDKLDYPSLRIEDLAEFLAIRLAVEQSTEREFHRSRQFTGHHIRMQRKIDPSYSKPRQNNRVHLDLWYPWPPTKGGHRHGNVAVHRS